MNVRWYQTPDHEMLDKWAKTHGNMKDGFMPEQYLPSYGKVAEKDGVPVAALFVYDPGVPICMINWPISNPDVPPRVRLLGLTALVLDVLGDIKPGGIVAAYPGSRSMKRIFEKCGFTMINEVNNEMTWGREV